jgi:ADP-ribose pyrophosphatase YjhB (NUDIX family)
MVAGDVAKDFEEFRVRADGQDWIVSWYPPPIAPDGRSHGSAGVCVTCDGSIVLVGTDGVHWSMPAGRPEGDETWEQTLRREVAEEACATVTEAKLLGFCRSFCVEGREEGLALVRSFWRAQVELGKWEPKFEISHRQVFAQAEVLSNLEREYHRIFRRALIEACPLPARDARILMEAQ